MENMEIDHELIASSPRQRVVGGSPMHGLTGEGPRSTSPRRKPVEESPFADNEVSSEAGEPDSSSEDGGRIIASRSRKSTERFLGNSPQPKTKKTIEVGTGSGIKLGEISKIADKLAKVPVKDDALKRLHRVLFGSDGTATTRKKEIRLWNGTSSSSVRAAMANALTGAKSVAMLKDICSMLSLATGGDRAALEERIVEFLVKPTGSTAPLKKTTKSKDSSTKKSSSSKKSSSKSDSSPKRPVTVPAASAFSNFVKTRMADVMAQAGGSMAARDVTELLTMEWKHMSDAEKSEFAPAEKPKERVQKVIVKPGSPRKVVESSEENNGNNSSSDSSSSGSNSEGSSSSNDSSSDDE